MKNTNTSDKQINSLQKDTGRENNPFIVSFFLISAGKRATFTFSVISFRVVSEYSAFIILPSNISSTLDQQKTNSWSGSCVWQLRRRAAVNTFCRDSCQFASLTTVTLSRFKSRKGRTKSLKLMKRSTTNVERSRIEMMYLWWLLRRICQWSWGYTDTDVL